MVSKQELLKVIGFVSTLITQPVKIATQCIETMLLETANQLEGLESRPAQVWKTWAARKNSSLQALRLAFDEVMKDWSYEESVRVTGFSRCSKKERVSSNAMEKALKTLEYSVKTTTIIINLPLVVWLNNDMYMKKICFLLIS